MNDGITLCNAEKEQKYKKPQSHFNLLLEKSGEKNNYVTSSAHEMYRDRTKSVQLRRFRQTDTH